MWVTAANDAGRDSLLSADQNSGAGTLGASPSGGNTAKMSSSSIYGTAPITINGLSSGLDTSSIIKQLSAYETQAQTSLQNQQATLNSELTQWQTFNGTLTSLQSISQSLAAPSAFNVATATIDQNAIATVKAQSGAAVGAHTLTVKTLAQAQKALSGSFSDPTIALNISGSFVLNGKTIAIASTDTLNSVVTKINSASVGVAASTLSAASGSYQLSLAATNTGTVNAISAADLGSGNALESLGLVPSPGATVGLRQSISTTSGGGAASIAFSSSSQPISTLLGSATGQAPAGDVTIAGTTVHIDTNTMSLTDIANAINTAGISGVQAQIVGVPDPNGNVSPASPKQLQIVSTNSSSPLSASSFTDSNDVLSTLGVLQTGFTTQPAAAQDATFTLDGVGYTRASNTVTDALTNVTMKLLSTNNSATSTAANIGISADTSSITTTIGNFVTAYNGVMDGINAQMTYTGTTAKGGSDTSSATPPLFGNFTLSSIQSQLSSMLSVTNGSLSLAGAGITVNGTGDLTIDSAKLQTALTSNPNGVAGLFGTMGSSVSPNLNYVSAGSNTKASGAQGFSVNITQAASQATIASATAFTPLTQSETLTFSGGLFGSGSSKLALAAGTTIAQAISQINGSINLNQYLFASQNSNGELVLTSKGYGSNQAFSVSSNLAAGSGTTGIGVDGVSASGKDVRGAINGEAATGNGQSLMGNAGNKTTDGLQITYTGASTGNIGGVKVTQGLADMLDNMVNVVTDPSKGSIASEETSLNTQITDFQTQITNMGTEISAYEAQLTTEFNDMETQLSTLKSQQQALNAETGTTSTSTSSSGSSTSSTGTGK